MNAVEIWGGVECSVNRVRDGWHDQMELSGHAYRLSDLDLVADLGVRTLRYPVLWERTAPDCPSQRNWAWSDERLRRLRELAIAPIVGLVHHGSGPHYTNLLDGDFPSQLACYAGDVAARYPWVSRYTPINEPMTTARFSALYGHWYPHHRDDRSFARALINQCRGIALSMIAIRKINPSAELVQTEDLGTAYSTLHMAYQKDFDNERRWLTWDLLCGRVDCHHPMGSFLERCGISAQELRWFMENPCPPQVLGVNHYVTSDRYLDERLALYPEASHGGNSVEQYADAEAVRVLPEKYDGWRVIKQACIRYSLPVALTEVHMGCTREEQLRWLHEAHVAAQAAREEGCDVTAITVWALFGSYNWDKLLTQDGSYEPGAFDVRSLPPRPTAIARHIQSLTRTGRSLEPPFTAGGWWQLPSKVLYGAAERSAELRKEHDDPPYPLLIVGADGVLGREFKNACEKRNLPYVALSRIDLEDSDLSAVEAMCEQVQPWAIVNVAGYVNVDAAEGQTVQCFRDNVDGSRALAATANQHDIPFLTFSSDLVFDGTLSVPLNDVTVSPTYVPDLVDASLDLLIDGCTGLVHLVNRGAVTWCHFLEQGAKALGVDTRYLQRSSLAEVQLAAPRPRYSALASDRVGMMPSLEDAIARYSRTLIAYDSPAHRE